MSDYPVVIREQELDPAFNTGRFTQNRYLAHVVNWAISGGGNTPQEALNALENNFQSIKKEWELRGRSLVRPGPFGPIELAAQDRIIVNEKLSEDFTRRVLDLDWAWISNESSLWDFHMDETNEKLQAKIKEVYGVDVSDIKSGRLPEILDRIATKGTFESNAKMGS